jgi:N-ethylmaleimide reductase
MTNDLFSPIVLGSYSLPNRMVMAPMGRARSDHDRAPDAVVAEYYRQRASAGLIISEACHVSPYSVSRPGTSAIHTERQIEAWRGVAEAVHSVDGRMFLQLYHLGRKQHQSMLPDQAPPVAPSSIRSGGMVQLAHGSEPFSMPRALALNEIQGIVDEFRRAAGNAVAATLDGVEIHAANGYLIDQFLRDGTNQRSDRYGGSIANRARFLIEVVEASIGEIGAGRVGVKVSPHFRGDGIDDSDASALYAYVAKELERLKVAYFHVVEGVTLGTMLSPDTEDGRLLAMLRGLYSGPLMINGGFDQSASHAIVASGAADLVSFGELFLANPDLVRRFSLGSALNAPRPATFWTGGAEGYVDYPNLCD